MEAEGEEDIYRHDVNLDDDFPWESDTSSVIGDTFQFVNSFLSLFYIGFYLGDMDRLRDQLAALLITRQVLGNLKETLMPYITWKAKLYTFGYRIATKMSPASVEKEVRKMTTRKRSLTHSSSSMQGRIGNKSSDKKMKPSDDESSTVTEEEDEGIPSLTQAEVESAMKKYEDTLDDYLEMCIQFGYVTLFSSAFPLAALCALVNNVIEIRSDAFKLCLTFQRPFGQRVENIGIWHDVLQYIAILAVIVNCILMSTMGVVSRLVPGLSPTMSFLVLAIIEHLVITLKLAIARAIPDMPQTISTEMAKLEYQRREALKKLESQATQVQTVSQVSPGSPGMVRRRVVEGGTNKDSPLLSSLQSSSSNQVSPLSPSSVITPSSFMATAHSPDISSVPASLQSFLPPTNMPKPEVPPRTSLLRSSKSDDSSNTKRSPQSPAVSSLSSALIPAAIDVAADKVVTAAMQPVLGDNLLESKSINANMLQHVAPGLSQSHQSRVQVQLRPRVKPVMNDDGEQLCGMENVGRRFLRRRLDLDARRGVSDPVTGAVSMALRLHHDGDSKTRGHSVRDDDNSTIGGSGSQLGSKSSSESAENPKDRRQDLLRRSLHNIAQREELRRTASCKHHKRANDKVFSDSAEAPATNRNTNSSPRFMASTRSKPGLFYSSQFLSHKSRSHSSDNLVEPSFSWRDRHSWQAESSSSSSENRHSKKLENVAVTSEGCNESPLVCNQSIDKVGTKSAAVLSTMATKPPSGLCTENKKLSSSSLSTGVVLANTEDKDILSSSTSHSSSASNGHDDTSSSPSTIRAMRNSSNQPLSISTRNLKPD